MSTRSEIDVRDDGAGSLPRDEPARVRVIVVNYNGGELLRRCLAHLIAQTERRFEAVVVDNGSHDGSLDGVPEDARISVLTLGENVGFAAANNAGFAGCRTPFVALLNPDAFAAPDWLEALLAAADEHASYTMFGSLQRQADKTDMLDGAGDVYFAAGGFWRGGHGQRMPEVEPEGESFGPCAAAALYRSAAFAEAGGFDERFFCYAEDIDLAFRLRLLGGRALQVGNAVVDHVGSALTGKGSDFSARHLIRNQIWTFVKCMPWPLLVMLAPMHLSFLIWIRLRAGRAGQGRVVGAAIAEAVRGLGPIWQERKAVQAGRRARVVDVARALSWSPGAMRQKAIVLWPATKATETAGRS